MTAVCQMSAGATDISGTQGSICCETNDQLKVPAFKKFYPGLTILGQHFKVWNKNSKSSIQYHSVCTAMSEDLQSEILNCLKANSGLEFDLDLLDESPTENTYFTLQKNQIRSSGFAENK